MSLLLDTHALLWWTTDSEKLSAVARQTIADHDGPCYVSAASVYELTNKVRLGKLDAARELMERLDAMMALHRLTALPVTMAHAKLAGELAGPHPRPLRPPAGSASDC